MAPACWLGAFLVVMLVLQGCFDGHKNKEALFECQKGKKLRKSMKKINDVWCSWRGIGCVLVFCSVGFCYLSKDIFTAPCVSIGRTCSCCFRLEVDDQGVMMNWEISRAALWIFNVPCHCLFCQLFERGSWSCKNAPMNWEFHDGLLMGNISFCQTHILFCMYVCSKIRVSLGICWLCVNPSCFTLVLLLCGMLGLSAFMLFMWVLGKTFVLKGVLWSVTLRTI